MYKVWQFGAGPKFEKITAWVLKPLARFTRHVI